MSPEQLLDFIPYFIIIGMVIIGLAYYAKVRATYKIKQVSAINKRKKDSETFGGAINDMIDSAPKNLQQIESEINTIRQKAIDEHLTPEQTKALLSRLESEKDMLKLVAKYGHLAKPLGGTVGKLLEKIVGGIGG